MHNALLSCREACVAATIRTCGNNAVEYSESGKRPPRNEIRDGYSAPNCVENQARQRHVDRDFRENLAAAFVENADPRQDHPGACNAQNLEDGKNAEHDNAVVKRRHDVHRTRPIQLTGEASAGRGCVHCRQAYCSQQAAEQRARVQVFKSGINKY
jgi:hypothetical protein